MGLAWIYASFSKDPITQVGAQIVALDNYPLGGGYNGPSAEIDDNSFSWCRPDKEQPQEISKYDVVTHAEINAIDHSDKNKLPGSTLYVTGFPCKICMPHIVKAKIKKIIYMDFLGGAKGSLMDLGPDRVIAEKIARLGHITVEKFKGDLSWMPEWVEKMKQLGLY